MTLAGGRLTWRVQYMDPRTGDELGEPVEGAVDLEVGRVTRIEVRAP